ncbi:MAG: hypothetical protein ACK5JD_10130 [Mangrovibacterium sp.]
MKILFRTKEEANREQQEAFLALSPEERFLSFLELSRKILQFPMADGTIKRQPNPSNFIIRMPDENKSRIKEVR